MTTVKQLRRKVEELEAVIETFRDKRGAVRDERRSAREDFARVAEEMRTAYREKPQLQINQLAELVGRLEPQYRQIWFMLDQLMKLIPLTRAERRAKRLARLGKKS